MKQTQSGQGKQNEKWLRLAVSVLGVLLVVLIFFANKTQLNDTLASLSAVQESGSDDLADRLPPLPEEAESGALISRLNEVAGPKKLQLLDSIIISLQARNRFDYAALYAERKVDEDSSLQNTLAAGLLNQQAGELSYIKSDSLLFTRFNTASIKYLETYTRSDSTNEKALIALGLGYVASNKPENSMKGILTLRRVVTLNPNNVEAGFRLGLFSLQTGQLERAIDRFNQVLRVRPDFVEARFQLAYAYSQSNNPVMAKKLLEQVVREAQTGELKQAATDLLNQLSK